LPRLAAPRPSWQRHLEGWQLGVVAVGIALCGTALLLPRGVSPRELPLPAVDRVEEAEADARDAARLASAERIPLPYLVRAAGESFRRFGAAESAGDAAKSDAQVADLQARFDAAKARYGSEPLLALRAVQTDLFVRAVHTFEQTGRASGDLTELGGSFLTRAAKNGWTDAERRLVFDDAALACIFRLRWSLLAGALETFPFSPSLDEWRLYFRTLLVHPEGSARARADRRSLAIRLTSYVAALAKRDPDYPELLARGILESWAGHPRAAADAFREHLRTHDRGPWHLRAQNYLADAVERAAGGAP